MRKFVGWIYSIKNKVNGKLYIGRTNNFNRRYNEHFGREDSCTILRKAFCKYGKENFEMVPIISFTASSSEVLDEVLNLLESYYIKKYNTYKNGYNATLGGEGTSGWIPSEETIKKRSKSLKGRKISNKERERLKGYVLNRVWTPEQREKQRQNILNRNPEINKRIADKLRGRKRDNEMIAKAAKKRRKPILQYSVDGTFIREYDSASRIAKNKGANIAACCKGRINSAYGYIWKYKTSDTYPLQINEASNWHKSNRPIIQYDKYGKVIGEYESATKASEITKIGRRTITNCLKGRSKSAGGYIWKYKEIRRNIA